MADRTTGYLRIGYFAQTTYTEFREHLDRWSHMRSMEGAGDLQRDDPGLGRWGVAQRSDLLERAGGDHLARAVDVGRGQAERLEGAEHLVGVSAQHRGHAGGRDRAGLRHRTAASGDEGDGLFVGDDAGQGRGGQLTDGVAGEHRAGGDEVGARGEERRGDDETGRDDERLSNGGVLDGVGVGLGAVLEQVEARGVAERCQLLTRPVELEPGGEEAGGLGALSGAHDG